MFGLGQAKTHAQATTFKVEESNGEILVNGYTLCVGDVVILREQRGVYKNGSPAYVRVYAFAERFDVSPYYREERDGIKRLRVVRDRTMLVDYVLSSEIVDVIFMTSGF